MPPVAKITAPAVGTAAQARGSCIAAHHTSRQVQPIRAINSRSQSSFLATILGQILGSLAASPPVGP